MKPIEFLASLQIEDLQDEKIDWLLDNNVYKSHISRNVENNEIILANGLISRSFVVSPNCCCVDFTNLITGESIIRGIKPECRIKLNENWYDIGGLKGQAEFAYFLKKWTQELYVDPSSFQLNAIRSQDIQKRFEWKQKRYAGNKTWPPKGKELIFNYIGPEGSTVEKMNIEIHYEMYDGLPLISKWFVFHNNSEEIITINSFESEILAMVEAESVPQGDSNRNIHNYPIHFESDYIFSAMSPASADITSHWIKDPEYTSQVAYLSDSKIMFVSSPPYGPDLQIEPGKSFECYRTYELVYDSGDRQRQGLALCQMYRTIAPWVTENPIFMHMTTADPRKVKPVIDQCVELGFEMVILSFGCGIEMEWDDEDFYEEFQELFSYAHSKNIEIGTYSLFSSRNIGPETNVILPAITPDGKTIQESPVFGKAPCLASQWGLDYLEKLKKFIINTNADFIEHDGPYPGDFCASTNHVGHHGLSDSQYVQWQLQAEFYKWCCAHGIYINAPDWYFLSGSNKTGMGYKEVNWSLPRENQIIIARQNIYDGTWEKTPSMGWMFTPLTVYHRVGDWEKSTLEPLTEYKEYYETHLRQNFTSGVQSCYRGHRLYDSDETKAIVKKWVDFYLNHRSILDSDLVHIRRPDGRHIDGILHVNPHLDEKGLGVLHNPTESEIKDAIEIPLYYTGLKNNAQIIFENSESLRIPLSRDYRITLNISIPARSSVWFLVKGE